METNRKSLDRNKATAYFGANLGLPGLGSIMAGRRITGILQLLIALTGFAMTLVFAVWFIKTWRANHELPMMTIWRTGEHPAGLLKSVLIGLAGMGVFGIAWIWSAITGFNIRASTDQLPPSSAIPPRY